MLLRRACFTLVLPALLLATAAEAQRPSARPAAKNQPPPKQTAAQPNPMRNLSKQERQTVTRYMKQRQAWVRQRGENFRKIAVRRDYSSDWVVHRDRKVTAFLDWSDPAHPRFDPARETGEDHILASIPVERRAHLLVIPNRPREHVGQRLGSQIEVSDVKETLATMRAAERLATRLGIANPKIYVNSENSISVGYLHVHIVGERTRPYPEPLSP